MSKPTDPLRISDCIVFGYWISVHVVEQLKTQWRDEPQLWMAVQDLVASSIMRALNQVANAQHEGVRLTTPYEEE